MKHRPLGITCAALHWQGQDYARVMPGAQESRFLELNPGQLETVAYQPRMSRENAVALVESLLDATRHHNAILVTHNGLSFDFDILAEESGMVAECSELALNHIDTMFHFFCLKGFPVGLDAAAKGMKVAGKPNGMSGSQAPLLWQQGEYAKVLEYIGQDVRTTLQVAQAIEQRGYLAWVTRAGKVSRCAFPKGLLTVREAMALPEPDVSWMSDPWPRSKFMEWMER